jgi:hypothetical protein
MSTFTDPSTGKTYQMNPLTGGYTEVPGTSTSATTRLPSRDQLKQSLERRLAQGQQALEGAAPGLGTFGRYAPGAAYGVTQMLQPGNFLPGVASTVGGLASTAIASPIVRGLTAAMPGPLGKALRVAGPALAGLGGAYAAEQATSMVTKGATPGVTEPPRKIDTPLGPIYLNEAAAQEGFIDRQRQRELDAYNTVLSMDLSKTKDIIKFQSDLDFQNQQRNLPLANQWMNSQMVRQQALLASQGNQIARQSLLNTAGSLAVGGQAQAGETLRSMITSNPYANAVLR